MPDLKPVARSFLTLQFVVWLVVFLGSWMAGTAFAVVFDLHPAWTVLVGIGVAILQELTLDRLTDVAATEVSDGAQ